MTRAIVSAVWRVLTGNNRVLTIYNSWESGPSDLFLKKAALWLLKSLTEKTVEVVWLARRINYLEAQSIADVAWNQNIWPNYCFSAIINCIKKQALTYCKPYVFSGENQSYAQGSTFCLRIIQQKYFRSCIMFFQNEIKKHSQFFFCIWVSF